MQDETANKRFIRERQDKLKKSLRARIAAGAAGVILFVTPAAGAVTDGETEADDGSKADRNSDVTERMERLRGNVELQETTEKDRPSAAKPTSVRDRIIAWRNYWDNWNDWYNWRNY